MPDRFSIHRWMPGRSGKDGDGAFVLFVVLVAVVALSGLAVLVASGTATGIHGLSVDASMIRADAAAQAGMARALASFEDKTDTLALSPYGGQVRWTFDDADIHLRMQQESSKIDVLHGNPRLIRHVVEAVIVDPAMQREILDRINRFRLSNDVPEELSAILPARLRVSNDARVFEDHFTLLVDHKGVDPVGASTVVREALLAEHPGLRDGVDEALKWQQVTPELAVELGDDYSLPINLFTVEATAMLPNGVRVRRRALVSLASGTKWVNVLRETQATP